MKHLFEESPEERLFKAALGFSKEERVDFIQSSAGDDGELAAGALVLLDGYEKQGGDVVRATMSEEASARAHWAVSTEAPGTVIGNFKLIRQAGKGGMGTVWEAEQTGPIVRRVALKVIKLGMDTEEMVKRFERERQTLSVMENANIAVVYEVGATELGRPYFAMEFVEGEPITEYATKHELSVEQRLKLMLAVCSGIEHAHRKGVIHRDLKPSNLLVNGEGIPKIIDFGIAKASAAEGGSLVTRESQMLGTPAYMSPEQANGLVSEVDIRSDVYSLGVVLYELLAGEPPFDPGRLESGGIVGMQKILTEEEPKRPSVKSSVSTNKNGEPSRTLPPLKFEKGLDWIVMKALSKEPDRRYPSVSALSEDIERYLEGATVRAVPPSFTYWLSSFMRRHRNAVALIAFLLVVGLGAGLWQMNILHESRSASRQAADEKAERAMTQAANGKPLLAALSYAMAADDVRGQKELRQEYLENAARASSVAAVPVLALRLDGADICELNFDVSGRYVIAKNRGKELRLLDLVEGKKVSLDGRKSFDALAFSPDGKRVAAVREGGGAVELWSLPPGDEFLSRQVISERRHPKVKCLAFDAGSTRLAVAAREDWKVLMIEEGGMLRDSGLGAEYVTDVERLGFSPVSADVLALIGEKRQEALVGLDVETGEVTEMTPPSIRWSTSYETDLINPPIFSTDGRLFVSRIEGGWKIIQSAPYKLLGSKARDEMHLFDMTPDGLLGLVRKDEQLKRLYVDEMESRGTMAGEVGFSGTVTCADFSPDSNRAVGGDTRGEIKILAPTSGAWAVDKSLRSALADKNGGVSAVVFSPDGRHVLSSQYQGGGQNWSLIRLWRLPSAEAPPLMASDMSLDLAMINAATTLTRQGSSVPIPAEEWWARWEEFRRSYPEFRGHRAIPARE